MWGVHGDGVQKSNEAARALEKDVWGGDTHANKIFELRRTVRRGGGQKNGVALSKKGMGHWQTRTSAASRTCRPTVCSQNKLMTPWPMMHMLAARAPVTSQRFLLSRRDRAAPSAGHTVALCSINACAPAPGCQSRWAFTRAVQTEVRGGKGPRLRPGAAQNNTHRQRAGSHLQMVSLLLGSSFRTT